MKPVISYYGGKQRICSKVLPFFPQHDIYVEPFCGGATMFFAKKPSQLSVLNDINDKLITFYRVAQRYPRNLALRIQSTLFSESSWRLANSIYKNPSGYSDLDIAWAVYVATQQGFAKKINHGWGGIGRRDFTKDPAEGLARAKERLQQQMTRLESAVIMSRDYSKCISSYDTSHTLFYLDPPYVNTDQGHYKGWTIENQQELCNMLDNAKGSYVLSGYECGVSPQTAQGRVEIKATMSAKRDTTDCDIKRTEVLWICDRSNAKSVQLSLL